ncbi:MAG: hypothetical protein VX589_07970 [Myxococcota bacterium]|nr:hypothetical protein [Myxococcota bacterium]
MGRVLCIAGELSGDRLLARAVRILIERGIECVGIGGPASELAGLRRLMSNAVLNAGGLVEVVPRIPPFLKLLWRLKRVLRTCDGLLVVDTPEIGLRLLREAHRRGQPSAYLSPPQAWAWRSQRANTLKYATWVGCNFKFEMEWFRARGVDAHLVGHPFAHLAPLPDGGTGVAVLPGSRAKTVARILPICLAAAEREQADSKTLDINISTVRSVDSEVYRDRGGARRTMLHLSIEGALRQSRLALVGAGTASLEAVCLGRPVIILGQVHPISATVARRIVRVPHFGLPNLILGERVFPELIQGDLTPSTLSTALRYMAGRPGGWDAQCARVRNRLQAEWKPDALADGLSAVFER